MILHLLRYNYIRKKLVIWWAFVLGYVYIYIYEREIYIYIWYIYIYVYVNVIWYIYIYIYIMYDGLHQPQKWMGYLCRVGPTLRRLKPQPYMAISWYREWCLGYWFTWILDMHVDFTNNLPMIYHDLPMKPFRHVRIKTAEWWCKHGLTIILGIWSATMALPGAGHKVVVNKRSLY